MPANPDRVEERKPRSRMRRIGLVGLLSVLMLGIGGWWQREHILQWAMLAWLRQTPLLNPAVAGLSFDTHRAVLADLQFGIDTSEGRLALKMQGIQADYDLATATLDSVAIENATLHFVYRPENGQTNTVRFNKPQLSLPLSHLAIKSLQLNIDTPWGDSYFLGCLQADALPAGAFQLSLQDERHAIRLEANADFNKAALLLSETGKADVLNLQWQQSDLDTPRWQLEAKASAAELWRCLRECVWIPSRWRQRLSVAAGEVSAQNLGGVKLDLNAASADGLATVSGRGLLTKDLAYLASMDFLLSLDPMHISVDGHMDWPATLLFDSIQPWLPAMPNGWRATTGNVIGVVRGNWRPNSRLNGELYLNAHRLGFQAGPVSVEDGLLQLAVKDWPNPSAVLEANIARVRLAKDFVVNDLRLNMRQEGRMLTLGRASVPLFGGMLELLPAELNLDSPPWKMNLDLRNIDLARLLQALNYPQLSGTGRIGGTLPLQASEHSLEISNGLLKSIRPGVLRYQGPVPVADNLAFQALRDFRYQSLQAKIDYSPVGEYRLGVRLEGNNPELLAGHPIAFNVNLGGQLPELLQQGILKGDFVTPILKRAVGDH